MPDFLYAGMDHSQQYTQRPSVIGLEFCPYMVACPGNSRFGPEKIFDPGRMRVLVVLGMVIDRRVMFAVSFGGYLFSYR